MKIMKRFVTLGAVLAMTALLGACGKKNAAPAIDWNSNYGIVIEQGEDRVTFTLSPERSAGITQADLNEEIQAHQYFSAKINADGSVTRVVTKEYYDSLVGAIEDITLAYPGILVNSGEYPNFVFAAYTSDYKASVILTKSKKPDETELLGMYWLMEQAKDYFAVTGQDVNQETKAYIVNAYTGEYLYGTTAETLDEIDVIIAQNLIKE